MPTAEGNRRQHDCWILLQFFVEMYFYEKALALYKETLKPLPSLYSLIISRSGRPVKAFFGKTEMILGIFRDEV